MCRHLYEPDGHFTEHHLQDWQHSAMYLAFLLAGLIDLMAYYTQLPAGIDQVTSCALLLNAKHIVLQLRGPHCYVHSVAHLPCGMFRIVCPVFAAQA